MEAIDSAMTMPRAKEDQEYNVVFFIADISGYTRFIVTNEKELIHSQIIIKDILNAIIKEIDLPLEVFKLEGDAVFLYADKDNPEMPWDSVKDSMVDKIIEIFHIFTHKISELTLHKICTCNACNNVEKLALKIVAHSGKTVFFRVQDILELSGKDAIVIHRLLKNSVEADEYLLLTESALNDLNIDMENVHPSEETYDDIGTIKTFIYYPPPPKPYIPDQDFEYPKIFIDTLRVEIANEYSSVAKTPEKGFHFHTGRKLADMLDYDEGILNNLPEKVVESFAGTGNPFSLGPINPGEKVVDMGSGAGLDVIIAGRMVGPEGGVFGVDMTSDMIEKARQNAQQAGQANVKFHQGYNEEIPLPDGWADVIISNGAINLSPDKEAVFKEMYRVLKPGGRIMIADILLDKPVPQNGKTNIDLWAG
jgi:2-polyprenyl-3-methyl-5-hydroxy-6-metoxy-1,4-benzoquinol methylase